jgi:hypothetical protein
MSEIQSIIQRLSGKGAEVYAKVCTVINVDEDAKTCTIKPVDDTAELFEVPLQPDVSGEGFCLYPKKSSHVLAVFLDRHNAHICNISEIDKLEFVQNGLQIVFDATDKKISIGNEHTDLLTLLNDLVSVLKNLKVYTPQGVSGTPIPDTIIKLEKFETDLKQLLK